jgi:hypothetical protein
VMSNGKLLPRTNWTAMLAPLKPPPTMTTRRRTGA